MDLPAPNPEGWPPPPTNYQPPAPAPPEYVPAALLSRIFVALACATFAGFVFSALTDGNIVTVRPAVNGALSTATLLALLACLLCFAFWTHRVYKNLGALGAQGLRGTPAWAVGWLFIPILGLYRPYQVFRELWQANDPSPAVRASPQWRLAKTPRLLPAWWLWSLASWGLVLVNIVQSANQPGGTAPGHPGSTLDLVTDVMPAIQSVLGVLVVRAITERQEKAAHSST